MVKRDKWRLVFILAVILIAAFIVFPIQGKVRLGLDLMGGVHIVLQAKGTPENPVTSDSIERLLAVLRSRIDQYGIAEPVIQRQGEDRIAVDLPGIEDPEAALDLIGRTAVLEFRQVLGESPRVPAEPVRSNYDSDEQFKAAQDRWQQAKNEVNEYVRQMEDAVKANPDIVVGKGPGATAIPLQLPHFTLVGATTRAGLLPSPLRDRFGFTAHLDFYDSSELEEVISRSAALLTLDIDKKAIAEIAGRSRGTPRIANRLLRRVRDYAQVRGSNKLTHEDAEKALLMYEVDEKGLDRLDRSVLLALIERFNGGPVGLSTLAIAVGEETETVESVAEPFLVRNGFMARTPRGRVATALGWEHVGRTPPAGAATLFDTQAPDA